MLFTWTTCLFQLKADIKQLETINKELMERIQDLSSSHDRLEVSYLQGKLND